MVDDKVCVDMSQLSLAAMQTTLEKPLLGLRRATMGDKSGTWLATMLDFFS